MNLTNIIKAYAQQDKAIAKKDGDNWKILVGEMVTTFGPSDFSSDAEAKATKKVIREMEKRAQIEGKLSPQLPNAYSSAKSVIIAAMTNKIDLIDEHGNIRGKTEIQKALAELRAPETGFEAFNRAMELATKALDKAMSEQELLAICARQAELGRKVQQLAQANLKIAA